MSESNESLNPGHKSLSLGGPLRVVKNEKKNKKKQKKQ